MLNDKGISPLLLTIILIAFAVALGAMIMSWGADNAYAQKGSCQGASLAVQTAFGNEVFCYNEAKGVLTVGIKNLGKGKIEELVYRRTNPDLTTRDIELPDSALEPGTVYTKEIPYQPTMKTHIEIIPKVTVDGSPVLCIDKALVRESVPVCSTG
jgi:flagellin-like protein